MWTTFYLVKASFLALIWNIFRVSEGFRKAWWTVAIYTFLSFWPITLSEFWECGTPSNYASIPACTLYNVALQTQENPIYFRFAFHISTDCFILILPLVQIRKMHMPSSKKISIAAVFAIIIIDIIVGILRNAVTVFAASRADYSETAYSMGVICGVLEPVIAVFVCALPPYRALVVKLRFRKNNRLEQQNDVPTIGARRWRLPKPFRLLSHSIPSPILSISILREQTQQSAIEYSSTSSIETPEVAHVESAGQTKGREGVL